MKVLSSVIVAVLFAIVSARADWPLEPKDFRGVPFGATRAQAKAILNVGVQDHWSKLTCTSDLPGVAYDARERDRGTCTIEVGNIGRASVKEVFTFNEDQLVQVNLSFASVYFDDLRDIFIERYGPPTEQRNDDVKTHGGATFQNAVLFWNGEKMSVMIERYGGTITEGLAFIATASWLDAEAKRREAERKKAAKEF